MKRSREKEMMDLPGNPTSVLEEDLRNLRVLNRRLGAYRGIRWSLKRLTGERGARFSLLDVGAGSADIPETVVRWARRKGIEAWVVALEPNPVAARVAALQIKGRTEIAVVRAEGFHLPFPSSSFDFVFASQLLHHFSEGEIVALLREWSRVARRSVLVSDLIRHPLAYYGVWLLTRLFTRNPMTRVDAPLSVRRAFTRKEWREIFDRAAIGAFRLKTLFPFRLFAFFPKNHFTTSSRPAMPRSS